MRLHNEFILLRINTNQSPIVVIRAIHYGPSYNHGGTVSQCMSATIRITMWH